jgi:hypothetical protein
MPYVVKCLGAESRYGMTEEVKLLSNRLDRSIKVERRYENSDKKV